MTQEKLTLYSLGTGTLEAVSQFPHFQEEDYERGKPSYLRAQNREETSEEELAWREPSGVS